MSGRNRRADGTLTFIYSHTLTQLSRHASQTQFPVRGVGSARLILVEAQERGANATSASRNERPPGHRGAVGQGRPRLRRLGSGAPESGSHPLLGRPRVYPRYSSSIIFNPDIQEGNVPNRNERPRETGCRSGRCRGAASLARPAPRTAGPLASSAGAEARSNEEEGGARDLLLDVKAGPREFAQVGQVERGGRVCS